MRISTLSDISLPVKEPLGDVVVSWSANNVVDLVNLLWGQLTSPLVQVNLSDLHHQVREPPTDSLNGCHCKHHFLGSLHVCILNSQNVLKAIWVLQHYR